MGSDSISRFVLFAGHEKIWQAFNSILIIIEIILKNIEFIPKFFLDPKYICSKNCCGPKILNPEKAYTFFGPKKFEVQKNMRSKKMLVSKIFS